MLFLLQSAKAGAEQMTSSVSNSISERVEVEMCLRIDNFTKATLKSYKVQKISVQTMPAELYW